MSDNDGLDIFVSAEKRVEGRMNSPVEIESARIIREMFYKPWYTMVTNFQFW